MKKQTKNTSCDKTAKKRQQKNPKKFVASTLVTNLREVASTLFPKTLLVSFQKAGVEV